MQLRYLKRAGSRSFVWPPVGSRDGLRDTAKLRLEGVLTSVLRIGSRLSVTVRFEGRDYVALLDEWQSPPAMDEVEAALRCGIGRTLQAVGQLETREGQQPAPVLPVPPTVDERGY